MTEPSGSAGDPRKAITDQRHQPPWWRRALSSAVDWLERSLHPARRRRALRRLAAGAVPQSVLFVCEGNIYRSPFAAAYLAALVQNATPPVRIGSAGFKTPNRPCPPTAQAIARLRGVDLSAHRSALVTSESLAQFDLVVVMEVGQAQRLEAGFRRQPASVIVLGDLDPGPIERRTIADPWRASERVLADSYTRLERCVRALAASCFGIEAARSP